MDLRIDIEELKKVKAEVWPDGTVEIIFIGKHAQDEVTLEGFAGESERSRRAVVAKLKELLAATAKALGHSDPEGEVGLVEIECRHCDSRSDYSVVAQDLFFEVKEAKDAA
ncbi:MAG: hypothetical protein DRJ03_15175 [Chloroflexi bacterium]|nr:MAG: hypothetical protein DRJ03_15175 [Chloroflexota bacterium]